jgi:hypothetical protein
MTMAKRKLPLEADLQPFIGRWDLDQPIEIRVMCANRRCLLAQRN